MIHLKKQNHWENQTITPSINDLNKLIHEDKEQNNENNEKIFENSNQEHEKNPPPTRSSARIRGENYHHKTVKIKK